MSAVLYAFPVSAQIDQPLPKARLLAHAPSRRGLKERLSRHIEEAVWACKLAPESLNLPASADVAEVQVFRLRLKSGQLRIDPVLLRAIDQAIPSPLLFELQGDAGLCTAAAYKRANEADHRRWVLGDYLIGDWMPLDSARQPLPVALDMASLYRQLLRPLIPLPPRAGEGVRAQLERLAQLRAAERDCQRLAARLTREPQFNRKVELNRRLRECQATMEQLRR
jgi:hypothetical protein